MDGRDSMKADIDVEDVIELVAQGLGLKLD
jgi:hypothetical protein